MAATDLGPTEEISPSLRRDDVTDMAAADLGPAEEISCSLSMHTSSLTEKNSPSNQQLMEDKVTDLLGECDKLRREIAQWHDLQEETVAKINRHNSRLQEEYLRIRSYSLSDSASLKRTCL
ncbi:hypothetical protein QYE76_007687 [Lolium multiflorum]|uniref:Uncharacterized protein n=1 Tax=Lolium multiflorum TaxID=4521 RepID=A0AAD8VE61_LOLMU|nr:hypothetical protein QYE76_007687 [Lolium multiflorum]